MHLGWGLGDHATGASVMKLFMSEENLDRGDIEQSEWERLMIDYGLYLKNLGRLDGAILFLQRTIAEEKIKQASAKNLALALQNLSAVQVLRGLLRDAELSAREAREWAGSTTDRRLFADCSVRLATSLALRGRVQEAEELFEEVLALMRAQGDKEPARDLPGIRLAWLLIRLGRLEEADTVLREARTLSEKFGFGIITARVDALMAILACSAGMQHEAQQAIDRVREWALRRFDQEMLVASHLAVSLWAVRTQDVKWAERSIRDGLIEAMAWGYGVYWIDLKVLQGQLALLADRAHDARSCADAILAGVSQPESGQPRLFGAATAESRYLWGEGDAYQLRAEAHMMLGNRESARQDLIAAERIRSGLHDPNLTKTQSLLQQFLSIEV
jgi:tetratricopeptide (TPR) repeat protein